MRLVPAQRGKAKTMPGLLHLANEQFYKYMQPMNKVLVYIIYKHLKHVPWVFK